MVKVRKGEKLVCVPCGREVVVNNWGVSGSTLWCCGKPMKTGKKTKARKKAPAKK